MIGAGVVTMSELPRPDRQPAVARAGDGMGVWLVGACLVTYPLEAQFRLGLCFQCALLLWFVLRVPLRVVVGMPLCILVLAGHAAILSEVLSPHPDLTFIAKWIVNPFLLIAAASAIRTSSDLVRISRAIRLAFMVVLSVQLLSVVVSGPAIAVASVVDLARTLFSLGAIPSEAYYQTEHQFGAFLLTKNVLAAYLVSLYGVHLYLTRSLDRGFLLLVTCVVALCFSRQGMVMLLVILGVGIAFRPGMPGWFRLRPLVALSALVIGVVVVLDLVVDLQSPRDGMSERMELYRMFIHVSGHEGLGILGYGYNVMSERIMELGLTIDNFHFFAFNLLYSFGTLCFLLWSLAVTWLAAGLPDSRAWALGFLPLLMNLALQNFGIEFGVLIGLVLVVRAATLIRKDQAAVRAVTCHGESADPGNVVPPHHCAAQRQ